jgi:proteasome lid subunit RPN8/RPN11
MAMQAIISHYRESLPLECCGLLAGRGPEVTFVYPLTNALSSAVSFSIAPREHYGALRHAEANGWEMIGAFHSHPAGPVGPSSTDMALAYERDWVYLIVTELGARAFVINNRSAKELPIEVQTRQVGS